MSYEGLEQKICQCGYEGLFDAYEDTPICPCGKPWEWWRQIDRTNGIIRSEPGTTLAQTEVVENEYRSRTDDFGNVYYVRYEKVKPSDERLWHRRLGGRKENEENGEGPCCGGACC